MFSVFELNRGIRENAVSWCEICHSFTMHGSLLDYSCLIRPFEMESKIPD